MSYAHELPVLLNARKLSKTYGGVLALDCLDLEVERGEIHGLVGANGSGKSTFVRILAGVTKANPGGKISVGSLEVDADRWDPGIARAVGIRFVHQDPGIFLDLTVAENLAIGGRGFEVGPAGRIDWKQLRRRTKAALDYVELAVSPDEPMTSLRFSDRTMVAIARALHDQDETHSALLVLDEPTASLPQADVELLLSALRRFRARGQTILFVNHRLREVLTSTDRITVLRDGRRVACTRTSNVTEEDLARLIVGASLADAGSRPEIGGASATPKPILQLDGLVGPRVAGVTLKVDPGEIVGLAGLRGAGQSELLRILSGDLRRRSGKILLRGAIVDFLHPAEAMKAGIAYLPSDRADSIFADQTVWENLSASVIAQYFRAGWMRSRDEQHDAERLVRVFGVKTPSVANPVTSLSGGNQQKAMFARWLRRNPMLVLLDEPTQGVDVGARVDIATLVNEATERGAGVLVASSDVDELVDMCDRVLVMQLGRIIDELHRPIDAADLTRRAYMARETGETRDRN